MTAFDVIDGEHEDDEPRRTALDFIRKMQAEHKKAATRTVSLRDSDRPEFELVCELPTDMDELIRITDRAEKAAKAKGAPAFAVISSCMAIARYTRQIRVNGLDVTEGDGSAFADLKLQEALGVSTAWRAVRQLFLQDGDVYDDAVIGRLSEALTNAAGLNRANAVSVSEGEDPT